MTRRRTRKARRRRMSLPDHPLTLAYLETYYPRAVFIGINKTKEQYEKLIDCVNYHTRWDCQHSWDVVDKIFKLQHLHTEPGVQKLMIKLGTNLQLETESRYKKFPLVSIRAILGTHTDETRPDPFKTKIMVSKLHLLYPKEIPYE